MSDPKRISPMLDGFVIGSPLGSHDGVCCCPAMKENTDQKYIVKVISIPGSQAQLDALLFTGAYKDPAAALDYFRSLSDDVVTEAEALRKLSKLEGFLSYESWQVVPMENNDLGYQVYLLGTYKQSLDKFMRRTPMTHLAAVNLGLDMCAALAICRKAGYLYVDLKPSNIFVSDDREYRIGDLGFVRLNSLKYASLPSKYRSAYTAPEQEDTLATLNETVDTYAAGMILYQVFNNGQLPEQANTAESPLPAPLNADYEMAEIIMKAVAPDPRDRWDNPMAMGQALAAYLQRNTVNDVPLGPPLAHAATAEESVEEPVIQPAADVPAADVPAADVPAADVPAADVPAADVSDTDTPTPEAAPDTTDEEPAYAQDTETDEPTPADDESEEDDKPEADEDTGALLNIGDTIISMPAINTPIADATVNLSAVLQSPEVSAAEEAAPAPVAVMDEDDRRTMVVDTARVKRAQRRIQIFETETIYDRYEEELPPQPTFNDKPKKKFNPLALLMVLLLICALTVGGLFFYRNYYLQTVDGLKVTGSNNQLIVTVDTEIDDSLLTVICSDTYGNSKRQTLKDGEAVFTELTPDTVYKIQLEIDGFHQLKGTTYSSYITAAETKITSFTAKTGTEDGTVVLEFTVSGPEKTPDWQVVYSAEDEEEVTVPFTGHSVTLTGLTIGKEYTFSLIPATELYMVGENTLTYTASKIILAENLKITACAGGQLTAQWSAPADANTVNWIVRCYSEDGVEQQQTTTETTITFPDIQPGKGYTVEVKAEGMTPYVYTTISANPITVTAITVDPTTPEVLNVTWEFEGDAPEGGWHLMYTLDNNTDQKVVRTDSNTAQIDLRIPGSTYHLTVQAASGTTIFCEEFTYTCPDAESFNQHALPRSKINTNLLVTPSKANWSYKNVGKNNYTTTFKSGQKVSVLLRAMVDFYLPRDNTSVLCYVKDSQGNVISSTIYTNTDTWYNMWNNTNYHYFELDVQNTPTAPGEYTVYLLFNGEIAATKTFTITE